MLQAPLASPLSPLRWLSHLVGFVLWGALSQLFGRLGFPPYTGHLVNTLGGAQFGFLAHVLVVVFTRKLVFLPNRQLLLTPCLLCAPFLKFMAGEVPARHADIGKLEAMLNEANSILGPMVESNPVRAMLAAFADSVQAALTLASAEHADVKNFIARMDQIRRLQW